MHQLKSEDEKGGNNKDPFHTTVPIGFLYLKGISARNSKHFCSAVISHNLR